MNEQMYNQDEELLFAFINKTKIENEIKRLGYNNYQAKKESDKIYNESRKQYAIEFMRINEDKLDLLAHQDISKLLQVFITTAFPPEEKSKIWFDALEKQAISRLCEYILNKDQEDIADVKVMMPAKQRHKKKAKKIEYTSSEIESFLCMIQFLKQIINHRIALSKDKKTERRNSELLKYVEMVDKILNKDLVSRKKIPQK